MNIRVLAAPKKFDGHASIIQENAIHSWATLFGSDNIYLFGDAETRGNAKRLGVGYAQPETSSTGLPLLNSIYAIARSKFPHDYFLYINADIILLGDFLETAQIIEKRLARFFMVGRRTNVNVDEIINFSDPSAVAAIEARARKLGQLAAPTAIDYFLFPGDAFTTLPPLRIGRAGFDNVLIYWAKRFEKLSVVDATDSVLAIHQNHGYNHLTGGETQVYTGPDAQENLQMVRRVGGQLFFITESDYRLEDGHIIKNHGAEYYFSKRYLLDVVPALYPFFRPLISLRRLYAKIKNYD